VWRPESKMIGFQVALLVPRHLPAASSCRTAASGLSQAGPHAIRLCWTCSGPRSTPIAARAVCCIALQRSRVARCFTRLVHLCQYRLRVLLRHMPPRGEMLASIAGEQEAYGVAPAIGPGEEPL